MAIGMEGDRPCDITRNPHEQNSSLHFQQQLTNFSIAEILKPDFGRKRLTTCTNVNYAYPAADQRCSDSSVDTDSETSSHSHSPPPTDSDGKQSWPAWVYCTRYSDRPASGPRSRKSKKKEKTHEEKRPRTAFTNEQLRKLKREFDDNRYLTESRRQDLARDLNLNESQIKIWFQNKRAKLKKSSGGKHSLAEQLSAQGLYNHAMTSEQSVDSMS